MTKEELEKEAEEYTEKHWGASLSVIRALKQTYLAVAEPREKQIEELKKENAELRARLNAVNSLTPELEKRSKLKSQQLTIAKDLLLRFIELDVLDCYSIVEEAKQFLKENA